MSLISKIFGAYKEALEVSQERFEKVYAACAANGTEFYDRFLHNLIVEYSPLLQKPGYVSMLASTAERFFQRTDVDFIAIDGTCLKDPFQDFMVFFGASYGVRGQVDVAGGHLKYKRWSMDNDVSHVAYVPIPYAEANQVSDDSENAFLVSDSEKVDLSSIHTRLMQLAEVYLAYQTLVTAAIDYPRIILMDLSLSSVLMSTEIGMANVGLRDASFEYSSLQLTSADVVIAYSHPHNEALGVPADSRYRRFAKIISWFASNNVKAATVDEIASSLQLPTNDVEKTLGEERSREVFSYTPSTRRVEPLVNPYTSWLRTKQLFNEICDNLFVRKDPNALLYEKYDTSGNKRTRWMTPYDVAFLIAVGLRALIELCWERRVFLIGIVKDSSTSYFSRNYLGFMQYVGQYQLSDEDLNLVRGLPWTDRMLLEAISYQRPLEAPWSTIEFDSCFMTVRLARNQESNEVEVQGVRGNIISPERLFARSLAQFFTSKSKKTPLMGHVIFVDRLLHPELDRELLQSDLYHSKQIGALSPFIAKDKDSTDKGGALTLYFLHVLTRNLFPEVIGYPDPLHKADWGAKSVGDRVKDVIRSSEYHFRSRPLSKLFRTTRDEGKR